MLELFVRAGDSVCERVLERVDDGLRELVRVRDVSQQDARDALHARGGAGVPALWDGARLFSGTEAVLARLRAFLDVGRTD
jgi:hypothetical protein